MSRLSPVFIALVAGSVSTVASAQLLNWTNISGGSASTASNWNPVVIPGASHTLQFDLPNTFTVSYNNATVASLGHVYKRGTVTLAIGSPHTVGASGIILGDTSGDIATATLSTGDLISTANVVVADDSGSTGTLNMVNQLGTLATTGTAGLIVGRNGAATLNMSSSSSATISGNAVFGENGTSSVTATISGGSTINPNVRTQLIVNGATASRIGSGGDILFNIVNGARADFASDLIVANGSASFSTVEVRGTTLLSTPSRFFVGGNLYLGRNLSAGTAAGNGRLHVLHRGTAIVNGTLFIAGDTLGGTGELTLTDPASSLTCNALTTGSGASITHTGGTLKINGGIVSLHDQALMEFDGSTDPANPAVFILANGATYDRLALVSVGAAGSMSIRIESGSRLSTGTSGLSLGVNPGDVSTMTIDGLNSTAQSFATVVGSNGPGTLTIQNSALLDCQSLSIAKFAGSSGTVNVDHGNIVLDSDIFIGGSGPTSGGAGILNVFNTSQINARTLDVYPTTGSLTVNNSTLQLSQSFIVRNPITLTNATVHALSMVVSAPVSASGLINAQILNGTAAITANGPLTLNDGVGSGLHRTPLNVGPHAVTLNNTVGYDLGNTTMLGGTLTALGQPFLPVGFTLSGSGTFSGNLNLNGGTINPGGATGLRLISGSISLTGGSISGTRLELATNTLLQGGGSCNVAIDGKTASQIHIQSPSSLGTNTIDGFLHAGRLAVDSTLTIVDSNGFNLGPDVRLNNGTISSSTQAVFGNPSITSTMVGNGTIATSLSNTGTISPGSDTGDRTSAIAFTRTFITDSVVGAEGNIIIDVEGTSNGQFDILPCSQFVILGGTVTIRPFNGYTPSNGDRFSFITTPREISEQFDTLIAPRGWHIEYFQNHTDAVFCAADFNSDGIVDFFDYLDFVAAFSSNDTDADFNVDGVIDFFDYLDFVAAFSTGC
ncbi:MAG: hypothetical protein KGS45_02180 [Planctomycetes bacterium]|nr:hypothetical protein [Planctomycetota bacterium]